MEIKRSKNPVKYNMRRDSYKFSEEKADFFVNIGLQITRRCNLKCIHCCEPSQMADCSLKDIKKIVDKLSEAGLKKICITGGESLLRDDLVDILKYISEKKMQTTLSTNGFLLDEAKLLKIKPYIDNIRFSLHGTEKATNLIMANESAFDKIIKNINLANKLDIPVSVVSSVLSINFDEMSDTARLCEKNKIEKLYFFSLIKRGRGMDIKNEEVPFEKIQESLERINAVSKKEKWNLEVKAINWNIEGQCVLIFPNSDVVAVSSFSDPDNQKVLGNMKNEEIMDIWNKFPFKKNYLKYYKHH